MNGTRPLVGGFRSALVQRVAQTSSPTDLGGKKILVVVIDPVSGFCV